MYSFPWSSHYIFQHIKKKKKRYKEYCAMKCHVINPRWEISLWHVGPVVEDRVWTHICLLYLETRDYSLSPFVFLLSVIAGAPDPTVVGSITHRKDSVHTGMIVVVHRAKTHHGGEVVSTLRSYPPSSCCQLDQHGCHVACALMAVYNDTVSLWMRLEYELVDGNRVCPGIHKVRGRPATRSAVDTYKIMLCN